MENFIRRENLTIFRRRLAETDNDAQRQILLKLLVEEEAKGGTRTADTAAG
jgi:polyhydroxyalkanoate synthesis regulator protein